MIWSTDAVRATIPVGEECVINLDTSEAGQGRITCRIGSNVESDVDIDIVDNRDGTVSVRYTPRKPGAYTLEIKFGGQTIPHGTFTQQVQSPGDLYVSLSLSLSLCRWLVARHSGRTLVFDRRTFPVLRWVYI